MKKSLIVVLLLCFTVTGCTGSFNLTKKVYNMHRSQPDKWQDEFVFLVTILLPIYSISTLADAIVFNSIEFWTGENPVAYNRDGQNLKHVKDGSAEATLSFNKESDQVTIASKTEAGVNPNIVLEKADGMVLAKNEQGDVLFSSVKNDKGEIAVYDQNLELVKTYTPQEVNSLKEQYLK